jgi:hypothetical protein
MKVADTGTSNTNLKVATRYMADAWKPSFPSMNFE